MKKEHKPHSAAITMQELIDYFKSHKKYSNLNDSEIEALALGVLTLSVAKVYNSFKMYGLV